MFSLKSRLARALLALSLLNGAGAALAAPTYHIAVDTSTLSGSGYLDLTFAALMGAAPATATLSGFTGNFGSDSQTQGMAGGSVGTTVTLGNGETFNELLQAVNFGGMFGFDVSFGLAGAGSIGTDFGVALVNATLTDYVAGTGSDFVVIGLMPGAPDMVSVGSGLATVTAVPEPAAAALFGAGMVLLILARRRRPLGDTYRG